MKLLAAALVVLTVTSVFLYPLCHQVFRCGCETMWGGGAQHCNVHAREGPHCPWCENTGVGALGFALTLALQVAVFALGRFKRLSLGATTLTTVAALPFAVIVSGGVSWLATDYPHFVVKGARERVGIPAGPIRTVR